MGRLDAKVAIITGGARGQGAAEARLFAQEGAKVVFGDLLDNEGRAVEEEIRVSGGDGRYVHLDVSKDEDWRATVETAVEMFGRLDILVNNAAIIIRKGVEETTEEDWDRIMAINVKGVFLGTKHCIPRMRRSGGGSIVNIGSTGGLVASRTSPAYSATKGAVRLFTKATAIRYADDKIRCNIVHPGPVNTPMGDEVMNDSALLAVGLSRIPLGRRASPEEIAYGVLYMASDESSFVTGAELVIDGGSTAQ